MSKRNQTVNRKRRAQGKAIRPGVTQLCSTRIVMRWMRMAAVITSLASEGTSSPSPQLHHHLHIALTFTDLFHQLDARLPHGYYRIPGLVSTPKGTLLVFVMGRFHRTDATPNIVYADPPCAIHNPQFAHAVCKQLTKK